MGILDTFFKAPGDINPPPAPATSLVPPVATPPANPADPNADPAAINTDPSAVPATPPTKDPNDSGSAPTQPNPLDVYKKVLDNANKDDKNLAPSFAIDDKTMDEVAASLDFTKGIDKAIIDKAMGGDAGAVLEFVNAAVRNTYKTTLQHATKLTGSHLDSRSTFDDSRIREMVRGGLTENSLSQVQNYDHPVAREALNKAAADMAKQFPDKTPQQIAVAARDYLQELAKAITEPSSVDGKLDANGQPKVFDYHAYLTSNEQ